MAHHIIQEWFQVGPFHKEFHSISIIIFHFYFYFIYLFINYTS